MRRTALVTGGSRGIGRACVEKLARDGWSVIFLCRKNTELADILTQQLRDEGYDVSWRACDLANSGEVRVTLQQILHSWHHIDLLVNNAGISHIGLVTDMSEEEWDHIFDVNLKAAFLCSQAVLPEMISRQNGCIVNISSMWGQVGASCEVAYSATKAGLIGLTKALAQQVGPSGIRVNCIAPGVIDTDMNAELGEDTLAELKEATPLGRLGTPQDVAELTAFLASEQASFITGQVIGVNGGYVIV